MLKKILLSVFALPFFLIPFTASAALSISGVPSSLSGPGSVTLSWVGAAAAGCTRSASPANPLWGGVLPGISGTLSVPISVTTTFSVSCGIGLTASVTIPIVPPATLTLTPSVFVLPAPGTVTLTWAYSGPPVPGCGRGSSPVIPAWVGPSAPVGNISVPVSVTTTFSIACGALNPSVTVTVTGPPPPPPPPPPAAAPSTYTLIAPLGPSLTGSVTLSQYLQGMLIFIIGIAGVLAVVMIVICGIQMMGSSVSGKSAAKECIWNAIFGLLIAIASWAILNTINPLFLASDVALPGVSTQTTAVAPTGPTTEAAPTGNGCFFKYQEISTGDVRYGSAGTQLMCEQLRSSYQADTDVTVQTTCFCNNPGGPPGSPAASTPPPATTGVTCPLSGRNLCEGQSQQCTNPSCAQFAPMASTHAGGAASPELIKAVILQESSCGIYLTGDGGASGGPMHMKPSTANVYRSACGIPTTQVITVGWLSQSANFDKAVCLGAEYLRAVSMTSCGTNVQDVAAGYNGGPGACAASVSCSSDTSCSGAAVKKWECLYDDSAHTQCNAGYNTTRNYATRVLYCKNNPGY